MNEVDLRTIPLGQAVNYTVLRNQCEAVWGGVSWPGKRPGFAVVVAIDRKPHFDNHDVFLLDEFESGDMRKLVRQCGALDLKYGVERWVGDYKNDAASHFIEEVNSEYRQANSRRQLSLQPTCMLDMENLYAYILPEIKDLLTPERRMLFLNGSKILSYLSEIEESEIAELERGAYPAIEALAFAVIELRDHVAAKERSARIPDTRPQEGTLDFGTKRDPVWN